jgi:hypothetical protein
MRVNSCPLLIVQGASVDSHLLQRGGKMALSKFQLRHVSIEQLKMMLEAKLKVRDIYLNSEHLTEEKFGQAEFLEEQTQEIKAEMKRRGKDLMC